MNLIIFSKGVTFEIQDVNFVRRLNFITTNNNFLLWNQTQGRGGGEFLTSKKVIYLRRRIIPTLGWNNLKYLKVWTNAIFNMDMLQCKYIVVCSAIGKTVIAPPDMINCEGWKHFSDLLHVAWLIYQRQPNKMINDHN